MKNSKHLINEVVEGKDPVDVVNEVLKYGDSLPGLDFTDLFPKSMFITKHTLVPMTVRSYGTPRLSYYKKDHISWGVSVFGESDLSFSAHAQVYGLKDNTTQQSNITIFVPNNWKKIKLPSGLKGNVSKSGRGIHIIHSAKSEDDKVARSIIADAPRIVTWWKSEVNDRLNKLISRREKK